MKIHSITLICLSIAATITSASYAQNDADVFRLGKTYHGGSARFEAMGGAFGALGADISAAQINPAAMGRFSSSQFAISMGPTFNNTGANFADNVTQSNKSNFILPNIGIVLTKDLSMRNKGDMYSQFAFGMNRIANFNQTIDITGQQFPSLLEEFTGQAYGYDPSTLSTYFPFSTSLAWESYVIDHDQATGEYYAPLNSGDMLMNRKITSKGGVNEFFVSYSRNRMNKLYYGATVGIRSYNYTMNYVHKEDLTLADPNFIGFDYMYNLQTTGTGINLKLGAVYLVTDGFRIGAAFHTPTAASLTDKWSADMDGRFVNGNTSIQSNLLPEGKYKYRMSTPMKGVLSAVYTIGMSAIISADVEYLQYQSSKLKSTKDLLYDAYDFKIENEEIKRRMTSAFNYRVGAEYNFQQTFFVRLGFSLYGNAYKTSENVDNKADISYSGGVGYKKGKFSLDLAYVNRKFNRQYYPFLGSATADTKWSSNSVVITGSLRF